MQETQTEKYLNLRERERERESSNRMENIIQFGTSYLVAFIKCYYGDEAKHEMS
jgi:hypothetical protein